MVAVGTLTRIRTRRDHKLIHADLDYWKVLGVHSTICFFLRLNCFLDFQLHTTIAHMYYYVNLASIEQ